MTGDNLQRLNKFLAKANAFPHSLNGFLSDTNPFKKLKMKKTNKPHV
jgi:hypothetical protein